MERKLDVTEEAILTTMEELVKTRQVLREQLMGVENQLFILKRVGERVEEARKAAATSSSTPTPPPSTPIDPLASMGLSAGDAYVGGIDDAETDIHIDEDETVEPPVRDDDFDFPPLVPCPDHPGNLITPDEAARLIRGE